MPYTGLNGYASLDSYKGSLASPEILKSYEQHIRPFTADWTSGGSSLKATVNESDFVLQKGTRVKLRFKNFSYTLDWDDYNLTLTYTNSSGTSATTSAYPITTCGAWEMDKFPIGKKTELNIIFNGEAWEVEDSLIGFRDRYSWRSAGVATQTSYNVMKLSDEPWWDKFEDDVYPLGSLGRITYEPNVKLTYFRGYHSIANATEGYRFCWSDEYGEIHGVAGFESSSFYGTVGCLSYIQGAIYVVRCEWDSAAAEPEASAVTSLWKSTDGKNFTRQSTICSGYDWCYGELKYNGTYWLFCDRSNDLLWYSTNGNTWTSKALPAQYFERLSVANGRFYLTNDRTTSSTAYYATNPASWSSCSMPTTGIWTDIVYTYDYGAATYYYMVVGGSADSTTANSYVAYSTSGTGSWTNTTIATKGVITYVYNEDCLYKDDSSLGPSADYLHWELIIGPGYPGYAYLNNGFKYGIYNYFDKEINAQYFNYGEYSDMTMAKYGNQMVYSVMGGSSSVAPSSPSYYLRKELETFPVEIMTLGQEGILDVSKTYSGSYVGNGTYGTANMVSIYCPFCPRWGIIWLPGNNFYRVIISNPEIEKVTYSANATTGIANKLQTAYNTFQTFYCSFGVGRVYFYNASSAANQLNTAGQVYNYIFWG